MSKTPPAKMRLLAFPSGSGSHIGAWRHDSAAETRLDDIAYFKRLAETAEDGKFDALFLADSQGFRHIEGRDAFSRTDSLRMEPITVLAAISTWTRRLGLISTLSTSYNEPYSAARRLATLDIISRGRAGWNVVTSTTENEARNFGRESHYGHAERYRRAAEFIDVCKGLWDTWDDDAVVRDRASGHYIDPARLHGLAHKGEHFSVAGPLTTPRPPQGYPVIVQAGSSDDGQALAATTAEVVFTTHPTIDSARGFYRIMKEKVAHAGREASECLITPAIHPLIGATETEARAMLAELNALVHPDLAMSTLQLALGGADLRHCDPNGPLPPIPETNQNRTMRARVIEMAERDNLSVIELARRVAVARSSKPVAGSPAQVADLLEEWFRTGAADAFVISGPVLPLMLERFVESVVPILQKRGLFRTEYEGETLRDHLRLKRPISRHEGRPDRHIEPEIWQATTS